MDELDGDDDDDDDDNEPAFDAWTELLEPLEALEFFDDFCRIDDVFEESKMIVDFVEFMSTSRMVSVLENGAVKRWEVN